MTGTPLFNPLANIVKVGGIWLTDLLNRVFDPYEEFTRPLDQKYHEWLHEKAAKFERDFRENFHTHGGRIWSYKLPVDPGDQCIWHGVYTAMWALKYNVTRDPLDLAFLTGCATGLRLHQHPTGETQPRLIRGWREDWTYEDEVSNDQATGHILGIYFLWKYGSIECREAAKQLAVGFADELAIQGNKLVNADGSVTKHGALENGLMTDPLNLTLALTVYAVAYELTGERLYKIRYDELVRKYRLLIPYANVKLLWWEKTHHAHRAAIHYSILCDLERDHDLRKKYFKGLLRTWHMERKSANPWIYYLLRRVCLHDPAYEDRVRKHLKEFTLEEKQYNVERINSTRVETFQWGKYRRARQPVARWRVGSQDFFWQRHMYSADDWLGNATGNVRHNGADFLIAYWGLRSLRLLGATE